MILLKNGNVYTMAGQTYKKGYVVIDGTKIASVGEMEALQEAEGAFEEVHDCTGMIVMPGMVDGHNHIGMWEDGLGFEGDDGNEDTDPIMPHLRALDAVNPLDRAFSEGLRAGVTTSVTGPGSANVLGGQFVALKMAGKCVDDMIVRAPVAVKAAFGENPKTTYHDKNQAPTTRMATAALLREALMKAKEYGRALAEYKKNPEEADKPEYDIKNDSLLAVLSKKIPLKVHAHRSDDMFTALRIAKEFDISITLEHATEAHLMTEYLDGSVPLLVGPLLCDRSKPELRNLTPGIAGILEKAGLAPAIITDHPEIPVQYLPLSAAIAVREGMPYMAALEAVTIRPARYTGIADRVGSLEVGKDADIAVFDGDPLAYTSKVVMIWLNGKKVSL